MRFTAAVMPIALAMAATPSASAQQEVKFCSAAPVSGPSAHLGKDTENGARFAVEDLNAQGATTAVTQARRSRRAHAVASITCPGSDPAAGRCCRRALGAGVAPDGRAPVHRPALAPVPRRR